MIRNVVLVRLRDGVDPSWAAHWRERVAGLDLPGTVAYTQGADLGLRDGTWSFALVADVVDEEAYRRYDLDEEHNRLRDELAPWAQDVARVQFEL
ncbi:Dabb family protein [Lapillicoccus jejuensis]|uniref:Stress responsive alpha/beta barrel protein n=1 Tax=Lapillicoccus jejuensis TaxID=402171 RepID=A0A542E0M4_9MICO|nr:Dabb family protein [Lapillicoccus jejuensis]TQJ08901.1 stress responsive alpha/beta barrel protein [Lapillicoccus jejuensis]